MADFNVPRATPGRDLKISELPALTTVPSGEIWIVCVSDGATKRILLSTLLAAG